MDQDDKPSPYGKILFVISDIDHDWEPLIVGFEGVFIDEEIAAVGHKDLAQMIPMPPEGPCSKDPEAGFYVWSGDVDWRCIGRDFETGIEDYQLVLDKGEVRLADYDDLDLARNFHLPKGPRE